jgi:hypothetical protein
MKSRRFTARWPPLLSDRKDSTSQLRQETAALRDFGLAYDGFGSKADLTPSLGHVRFAPRKQTSPMAGMSS